MQSVHDGRARVLTRVERGIREMVETSDTQLWCTTAQASDVPMLRTLAQAAVMIDECSDDDEAAAVSSPQGGNILGTRSSSLEDLQSRRNELLRKLEAAKLMAKKVSAHVHGQKLLLSYNEAVMLA